MSDAKNTGDNTQTANGGKAGATEELEQMRVRAAERDQYLELAQRSRAEFENYQKRVQRDREQERKYAFGPIALDLLPLYDNLARALAAAQVVGEEGPLVQGVSMVEAQFLELLKKHSVTPIEALGKPFDPHVHHVLMQKPTNDVAADTVVQVIEQGFMNQDRVLRPAKVIVSKKPD